jgi:hypothetical protein
VRTEGPGYAAAPNGVKPYAIPGWMGFPIPVSLDDEGYLVAD